MKKIGSAILTCALCFCALTFLQAQSAITTIIAPTAIVPPSTIFKADIKVAQFKKIVGMQFTLKWDTTVLRFREVKNFVLSVNPQAESFGKTKATTGMLAFQWFDESLTGKSLDDSTTIFSIEFEVIGLPSASTQLMFTDDIALREVADLSFNAIPTAYHTGIIKIASTTDVKVYNSAPHLVEVQDCYPNPFHEYTQVQLKLNVPAKGRLFIQNIQGQTVYEEQRSFAAGAQTLKLTKEMFPAAGTYYYTLQTTDFIITQKLIFL